MAEYFVGVDVSKGYADFAVLDEQLERVEEVFRLDDSAAGHETVEGLLRQLIKQDTGTGVFIGLESTGGFEANWHEHFRRLGSSLPVHCARINPVGIAQYVRADGTRTVTDAVSAVKIAQYIGTHRRRIRFDEHSEVLEGLRPLWTLLMMLKKQRGQLANNLHQALYGTLPSILVYCRRGFPRWVLEVLGKYPTSRRLARARVKSLGALPYVTTQKAEKLVGAAKKDVGAHTDETAELVVMTLTEQMLHLEKVIAAVQKAIITKGRADPRMALLCSFSGIGELSAVGLLMNMPPLSATKDASHLASYWGLHPVYKSSGDGCTVARMSKSGRTQARAILFMVVLAAICNNPLIRALYRRLVYRKKMTRMAAIGVCMHKVARIVYGMLKTNTRFDPAKDRSNGRSKSVRLSAEQIAQHEEQRKRRYQQADATAPITAREKKRRERINGAQRTCGAEYGLTTTPSLKRKMHQNRGQAKGSRKQQQAQLEPSHNT
jgi:transposase